MKYVCNRCSNVFQADDITIHYSNGDHGVEILAICPTCLEKHLGKTKGETEKKVDENERNKMIRKW